MPLNLSLGLNIASGGGPPPIPFDPLDLAPSFWFRPGTAAAHPTITLGTGGNAANIAIASDAAGGPHTMLPAASNQQTGFGTASPLNGRAYAEVRGPPTYSSLVGTGLAITGNVPWSIVCAVRFVAAPSTQSTVNPGGLAGIGTVGTGSGNGGYLSVTKTGPKFTMTSGAGQTAQGVRWGSEALADGTPGTTLPVTVVLALTYDGAGIVRLWVDGVLVDTNYQFAPSLYPSQAGLDFNGTVPAGGSFYLGPWYFAAEACSNDVFHTWWFDYALSDAQVKRLVTWTIADLALPLTAPCWIATGNSYTEGTLTTIHDTRRDSMTGGVSQWGFTDTGYAYVAARLLCKSAGTGGYGWPAVSLINLGHSGWTADQTLTGPDQGRAAYLADEFRAAIGPRRVYTFATVELGTNDAFVIPATTLARYGAGQTEIAAAYRGAGCAYVFASTVPPDVESAPSTSITIRNTYSAWIRANLAAAGYNSPVADLQDTGNATLILGTGGETYGTVAARLPLDGDHGAGPPKNVHYNDAGYADLGHLWAYIVDAGLP